MTKDSAKFLRVTDSSCTSEYPERHHSINVGGQNIPVVFKYGEEKVLPYEQALKFNIDGFTLEDTDGKPLVMPAVTKENIRDALAADEVVAKISELTLSSLKIRAGQKTGGEIYLDADDDARDDLIDFLSGKPPAVTAEASVETIDGEADLIDDEGDDTDEVHVGPAAGSIEIAADPATTEDETTVD